MSFASRVIQFEFLDSSVMPLKQLAAGHFMLRLLPSQWGGVGYRWRKLGVDGVVELQLSVQQCLHVKLASNHVHKPMKHERHLTEASMKASRVAQGLAELRRSSALVQASMPGPVSYTHLTLPTTPYV